MKKLCLITIVGLLGCTDSATDVTPEEIESLWGVDTDYVLDGGVGKDGIRAIENPTYISQAEATFLNDDDLILILKLDDEIRVYPHRILDYHEIVNTSINDDLITISYCPLTGTGFAWPGKFEELNTTFGVSGLLYNNNLILYDRETDGYWSQMRFEAIKGNKLGSIMPTLPLLETTWKTWKAMGFEETLVMQPAPGETYASYPYGEYRTVNEYILFPVSVQDDRIPAKERVLVMPNQKQEASAFRYQDMANVNYLANYEDFTLVAFPDQDLMVGFLQEYQDGSAAELSRVEGEFPVILEDQEGNRWDVFGRALSGPRAGQTLTRVTTTMAYFFCLSSVYDQLEIYGNYKPLDGG